MKELDILKFQCFVYFYFSSLLSPKFYACGFHKPEMQNRESRFEMRDDNEHEKKKFLDLKL